jgi:hypothetical protein
MRNSILVVAELMALVLVAMPASAATGELFFSEYIEGSSFNKAVEIYNGTGGAVDLAAGGYSLELYSNGSATVSQSVALSGTIADGDVHVLAHGSADAAILAQADVTNNLVINFNGDDGVVLRRGGVVVDGFGQFNVDPGSQWPGGGQNDTLRRKASVCTGDTDFSDTFDASIEWDIFPQNTFDGLGSHSVSCATGPRDPVINEFVANHTGSDSEAFVEVFGDANTDYSALTVLEIEGDSSSNEGTIDAVLQVGTTNAGGYWIDDEDMENGTITILLVENFSGSVGNDLDTDDDGTLDSTPWTRIVDDVAVSDGGSADITYSSTVLAPFFDGNPFGAGGASRSPNGTDTNTAADWVRNDFDGFGFPGFTGSPDVGEAENTPDAVNVVITVATDPLGACFEPATLIHDIQGSGLSSSDVGSIREIEGVVVGDFRGPGGLNGFFVQEEDADADGDASTSEGIFVYDPANAVALDPNDVVRVRGTVTEFNGLTEINNVAAVFDCNVTAPAPAVTSIILPVASTGDFEQWEGMLVKFPGTLYATGNSNQGRFGEVDLSVGGPLDIPTNVTEPGASALALQELNDRSRIQLDDGSSVRSPTPLPPYIGTGNTLRTGDTVEDLTAVLSFSFGAYELHPVGPVNFTRVNTRLDPPDVGGAVRVASFNVLNYFTTLDDSGSICGPVGGQGCRGADNALEFMQQRDKIVTAITKLDAHVVGLIEIENDSVNVAIADLVTGLNSVSGAGIYDYVATGPIGDDAIRVGFIYQPAAVSLAGPHAVLDASVDPTFNDDKNRPVLAQSFSENTSGEVFTVAVNHLKSKGSNCNDVGDPDIDDGQGNCNVTRTTAAQALVDWLGTDPTGSDSDNFLIIGDLNAYAQEDPVTTIEFASYVDLIEEFAGTGVAAGAYSFNFQGQSGALDHALSSPGMMANVTGAAVWHINADEPSALDYNDDNQEDLYSADQYRSSDHDPLVVGLFGDNDNDGVLDVVDVCPATAIPESVPTSGQLKPNRWALIDGDFDFDTIASKGKGPRRSYSTTDTAGCSCEQIIEAQGLGNGHTKFGCSIGAMDNWVELVTP